MMEICKKIVNQILKLIYIFKYNLYKIKCKIYNQKEFLIFNTPIHGNIGDHAIIYAEKIFLNKMKIKIFEIPTYHSKYIIDYIQNNISDSANIAITGGGFIGSQWIQEENLVLDVVSKFYKHNIVIFPQTIFFKNDLQGNIELEKSIKIFNKALNLYIFTREEKSFEFAKNKYTKASIILIPDIVLSLDRSDSKRRKGILVCLRRDVEGIYNQNDKNNLYQILQEFDTHIRITDTVINKKICYFSRKKVIKKKLNEFSFAKFVITDRLHGMIFATITNTPCIVLNNYNYKIEGVFKWISKIDNNIIFEKDIKNIKNDIEKILLYQTSNICGKYDFSDLKKVLEDING